MPNSDVTNTDSKTRIIKLNRNISKHGNILFSKELIVSPEFFHFSEPPQKRPKIEHDSANFKLMNKLIAMDENLPTIHFKRAFDNVNLKNLLRLLN